MKSPITGGEIQLVQEQRELVYRKEKFSYIAHLYKCVDSDEIFTTTKLDELNLGQVYNQYRVKYGIPFPDEIANIRELYGLSAAKMSEILGFGANQYRLYENGEMPSEANGKILKNIGNTAFFEAIVTNTENQFEPKEFIRIICKVQYAACRQVEDVYKKIIFQGAQRSITNGYAQMSYSRVKNIILFFIERFDGVFTTKMNKLLFYTDFASYKRNGMAMSGLSYKAIQYGPVPQAYSAVYGLMDDVTCEVVGYPNGITGDFLKSDLSADLAGFSEDEKIILEDVVTIFKDCKASDISKISHDEDAWINHNEGKEIIDFNTAFTLKAM